MNRPSVMHLAGSSISRLRRRSCDAAVLASALAIVGALSTGAAGCGNGAPSAPAAADAARVVSLGGGREMVLACVGDGSPTVVLVSGARGAHDDWTHVVGGSGDAPEPSDAAVLPQVARFTRVCAYDRPGTVTFAGQPTRSTPVLQPTSAADGVADLHALLSAAAVPGPYVLVAHSLGGVVAYLYAAEHPADVAGLVLVDPGSKFLARALTPAQWETFVGAARAPGDPPTTEAHDYARSLVELDGAPPLPAVPATVLTADRPFDFGVGTEEAWPAWLAAQESLAALLDARHVTATGSGHYVAGEQAALVTREIRAVVEAIRDDRPASERRPSPCRPGTATRGQPSCTAP